MFSRKLYRTRVSSHPSRGFLPTWRDPPRWRITNKPTASKRKYTRTAYTENISQTNHSTTSDVLFSLLYHLLPPRTRFILVASYIIYINRILDYWSAPAFALFQFFISLSPRPAWSIKAARNGYKWIWSAKRTAAGGKEIWCAAFLHDCVATSADDSISSTRHATRELASDIYIYKCEGKQLELFAQVHDMAWKCDFFCLFFFPTCNSLSFLSFFLKTGTVEDAKNAKKSHRRFPRTAGAFDLISRFDGSRCQDGRCGCGHWSLSYRKKQRKIHAGQSRTKCTSPTERVH